MVDGTTEIIDKTSNEFENTKHYAYLDLLENFKGEIIGGMMLDLFTAGNHLYGPGSIVIIPESDTEKFNHDNLDFKGRLLTYNPTTTKLVDLIHETLNQQNSWCCVAKLLDKTPRPTDMLTINGKPLRLTFYPGGQSNLYWDWFFVKAFSYTGTHTKSPCGKLEEFLIYFNRLFTYAFLTKKNDLWQLALPTAYIPIIKKFVLNKLDTILSYNLRKNVLEDLKIWKEHILSFINIHEFDSQLRLKEHKSLFYGSRDIWSQILEHRSDEKKLEGLSRTLPNTPSDILSAIENKGLNWKWFEGAFSDKSSYEELIDAYEEFIDVYTNASQYQKAIDLYKILFSIPGYQPSQWHLWDLADIFEKSNHHLVAANHYRDGIRLAKSLGDNVYAFRYKLAAKAYCTGGEFQKAAKYMGVCFDLNSKLNLSLLYDKLTIDLLAKHYDFNTEFLTNCRELLLKSSYQLGAMRLVAFAYILNNNFENANQIIQSIDEYNKVNPEDELRTSTELLVAFLKRTPDLITIAESYTQNTVSRNDWETPFYLGIKYVVLNQANHPDIKDILQTQNGIYLAYGSLSVIEDIDKVLDVYYEDLSKKSVLQN